MRLLVFAHIGEANTFLSRLDLKENKFGTVTLFMDNTQAVVICGQGLKNAKYTLEQVFKSSLNFISVYSIGICGSLKDTFLINEVYKIKVSLNMDSTNKFISQDEGINCISTQEIINTTEQKEKLPKEADLVDMELYSIAGACKEHNTPFHAYKLVADPSNEETKCRTIKQNAKFYSDKLFEFYNENTK